MTCDTVSLCDDERVCTVHYVQRNFQISWISEPESVCKKCNKACPHPSSLAKPLCHMHAHCPCCCAVLLVHACRVNMERTQALLSAWFLSEYLECAVAEIAPSALRPEFMAQSSSVWQNILFSKCAASPSRNVAAVIVGPPSSGKKVIMGGILGHNSPSAATPGAPLTYGHASLAAASGCEANLEVFAVGSNSQLLSVVLGQGACRSASDLVVVICLDVTLETTCVQQCQQLLDEVAQCCSATRAEADFKPAIVIFACKGDLLHVDEARWDVTSASLRLLALNYGAAFAVHSSASGTATSRQIVLASLQLASWPAPSPLRASFFVPPNHDSAASLRATLEVLGNSAPSLSSSSSKPLDNAPLKAAHPVAADDDQVISPMCMHACNTLHCDPSRAKLSSYRRPHVYLVPAGIYRHSSPCRKCRQRRAAQKVWRNGVISVSQ